MTLSRAMMAIKGRIALIASRETFDRASQYRTFRVKGSTRESSWTHSKIRNRGATRGK